MKALQQRQMVIGQHLLQRMMEHCLEEKPFEACGILTGKGCTVLHVYATDNCKRSPVYYEVDPQQQEAVLREMEAHGEELLGIYHSHPSASAEPSHNDIRLAVYYPEAVRVIVSLLGPTTVKAFLVENGKVRDVEIVAAREGTGVWHDLRTGA